jgi:hypothetical protein
MGAERKYASEYIRALLDGYPPNGAAPESFGGYQDLIDNLLRAYASGGTPKVREVWTEAVRRHPELAALVSWDRDHDFDGHEDDADSTEQGHTRPNQATQLVKLVAQAELFHALNGEAYATVPVDSHRETWPLKSKGFRNWLRCEFYRRHGKPPGGQALQDALGVLEGQAQFDGPVYPVFTRLAEQDGAIYLDFGTDQWDAVKITATEWRVVTNPPAAC